MDTRDDVYIRWGNGAVGWYSAKKLIEGVEIGIDKKGLGSFSAIHSWCETEENGKVTTAREEQPKERVKGESVRLQ